MRYLSLPFMLLLSIAVTGIAFAAEVPTDKPVTATIDANGVQHAEITGGEYYFTPKHLIVKINKPVELTVKKAAGFVPHNIIVNAPEAGIHFSINMSDKKPEIVKFTPTKVGQYPMYCDKKLLFFKSHKERGMEGLIEVAE